MVHELCIQLAGSHITDIAILIKYSGAEGESQLLRNRIHTLTVRRIKEWLGDEPRFFKLIEEYSCSCNA